MSIWDSISVNNRFSELPRSFFTPVQPTPLINVQWLAWNQKLALELGFPEFDPCSDELLSTLSGTSEPAPFFPLAMKYAGHQFGSYNPDLGDGRGLLLTQVVAKSGETFDLHLKGAGKTPYSRMGDGRAVIRSTVREYLCSEAMAGLNIPTTRALAMMSSDTPVYREKQEKGALLVRASESHIRFGHFEHLFYTNQIAEHKLLADKVLEWHFPECLEDEKPYASMFNVIVDRTAEMVALWQANGFAHGVMNTDNMSILGQTFDYGPFAFLDEYDPRLICNHSDYQGRYAFNQQPRIGLWNLSALAHSLSPLIDKADLEAALEQYEPQMNGYFSQLMRRKLGLLSKQEGDSRLFESMFELMSQNRVDYPRFFRTLSNLDTVDSQEVIDLVLDRDAAKMWLANYLKRCELEDSSTQERCEVMRTINPKYILRNYLAQLSIDKAEQGDTSDIEALMVVLADPYSEHPDYEYLAALPPEWGKGMEISCSS
ncbi:YdiU family protein [Vibrio sp. 99-70-13A1]|uniref:protein adenylyltransferase SelO n=1 Tax=Vibrio sp. 99-70-13A1 TaxID=2607601 RepID=UPI0014934062|nr:YdiU family protein [Vibrio sp. 99-70-13A1]NOH95446.1 YdiU family protein [Vibrio sp. 99-70-13A1]